MKHLLVVLILTLGFLKFAHSAATVEDQTVNEISKISKLKYVKSVVLANAVFPTYHPQGVKVLGSQVYLSTVEGRSTGLGHVIKFELDSATAPKRASPAAQLTFDPGPKRQFIHAGGVDVDGGALLVPLAEYQSGGLSTVMSLDLNKFGSFSALAKINDHVGAIVRDDKSLYLMNWDSKEIYNFDVATNLPRSKFVGTGWQYQDCKRVAKSYALCSALNGHLFPDGAIHLLRFSESGPSNVQIVHQIKVDNFYADGSPGGLRPLTYNAMDFAPIYDSKNVAVIGIRFYFVPHDSGESQLMIFDSVF